MLQGENLSPVAQRILGKQAHFRKAVEDDARRFDLRDFLEDDLERFVQFEFRGMQDCDLVPRIDK